MIDALRNPRRRDCGEQMVGLADEIGKELFDVEDTIKMAVLTIFASPEGRYSHFLLEAPPGMGKTVLCKTIAKWCNLRFSRIQLTPDMQPGEIIMTHELEMAEGGVQTKMIFGPIFTNILLADEINRTPPRTQSAILQPMAECETTYGGKRYPLGHSMTDLERKFRGEAFNEKLKELYGDSGIWNEDPESPLFYVFATQNPVENEGTYRLPEAQLDRFLFKMVLDYPGENTIRKILKGKSIGQYLRTYYQSHPHSAAVQSIEALKPGEGDPAEVLTGAVSAFLEETQGDLKSLFGFELSGGKEEILIRDETRKLVFERKSFLKGADKTGKLDPLAVIAIRHAISLYTGIRNDAYYSYVSSFLEQIRLSRDFSMKVSPRVCDTILSVAKAHCAFRSFREARERGKADWDPDRLYVTKEDINACARNMLPHRISLSYEAQARGVNTTDLVEGILRNAKADPRFAGIE